MPTCKQTWDFYISAIGQSRPAWFGGWRGHNLLMDWDGPFFPSFHFLVYEIRRLDQMSSQFYDFMITLESKTYRAKFPLPC